MTKQRFARSISFRNQLLAVFLVILLLTVSLFVLLTTHYLRSLREEQQAQFERRHAQSASRITQRAEAITHLTHTLSINPAVHSYLNGDLSESGQSFVSRQLIDYFYNLTNAQPAIRDIYIASMDQTRSLSYYKYLDAEDAAAVEAEATYLPETLAIRPAVGAEQDHGTYDLVIGSAVRQSLGGQDQVVGEILVLVSTARLLEEEGRLVGDDVEALTLLDGSGDVLASLGQEPAAGESGYLRQTAAIGGFHLELRAVESNPPLHTLLGRTHYIILVFMLLMLVALVLMMIWLFRSVATPIQNLLASLQLIRFSDRIRLTVDCPLELRLTEVPKMLLQPIFENAIEHGLHPLLSGGPGGHLPTFSIHVYSPLPSQLIIDCRDNGVGLDRAQVLHSIEHREATSTESIGLANVHQRLRLYYGDSCGVSLPDPGAAPGSLIRLTLRT